MFLVGKFGIKKGTVILEVSWGTWIQSKVIRTDDYTLLFKRPLMKLMPAKYLFSANDVKLSKSDTDE